MSKDNANTFKSIRNFAARVGFSIAALTTGVAETRDAQQAVHTRGLESSRDKAQVYVDNTLSLTSTDFQQNRIRAEKDLESLSEDVAELAKLLPTPDQQSDFLQSYFGALGRLGLPDIDEDGQKSRENLTKLLFYLTDIKGLLEEKSENDELVLHLLGATSSLGFLIYLNGPKRRKE